MDSDSCALHSDEILPATRLANCFVFKLSRSWYGYMPRIQASYTYFAVSLRKWFLSPFNQHCNVSAWTNDSICFQQCLAQCMSASRVTVAERWSWTPPWPYCVVVMVYRACAFAGYKPMIMMLLGSCYLALLGIELWAFLTRPSAPQDAFLELIGKTGCYVNYGNPLMQLRVTVGSIPAALRTERTDIS